VAYAGGSRSGKYFMVEHSLQTECKYVELETFTDTDIVEAESNESAFQKRLIALLGGNFSEDEIFDRVKTLLEPFTNAVTVVKASI
jgi:hypothetical protein